jgi:uncharacterized protein YqeY
MITTIKSDMKEALKKKEKIRLSTLRMLIATLENERIKLKVQELSEYDIITCINRNLKQLDQEIESLIKADRNIDSQLVQTEVLKSYLPIQLSEEEIRGAVETVVLLTKLNGGSFGEVMKALNADLNGKAEMRIVSKIAKELF